MAPVDKQLRECIFFIRFVAGFSNKMELTVFNMIVILFSNIEINQNTDFDDRQKIFANK